MAQSRTHVPVGCKRGFLDPEGKDIFVKLQGQKRHDLSDVAKSSEKITAQIVMDAIEANSSGVADPSKPFMGALPKLLRAPEVKTKVQADSATKVLCKVLQETIKESSGVILICAQDSQYSEVVKKLLKEASDEVAALATCSVQVGMGRDWLMTLPLTEKMDLSYELGGRLLIYVGTPSKYLSMCIRSDRGAFDAAYAANKLVVLCKGACMLPLGTQEENIFGFDESVVLDAIADALRCRGKIAWAHKVGSKATLLQMAFGYASASEEPLRALDFSHDTEGDMASFDYLVEYVRYLNAVKLARPDLKVVNYYDTGLLVSVLMGCICERGPSLLLDRDGVAMLRDASIGHIMSKLNQIVTVLPLNREKAVYNFFIGDGACRLNGGIELALHLIEGYKEESMITLFVFNNGKWAIEDNLVADTEQEHVLFNNDFYNLLALHNNVCITENDMELRETLAHLSHKTQAYLSGEVPPGLRLVVIRNMDTEIPPMLGNIEPIRRSPEMRFMRAVLGAFAVGCKRQVPIYGCSAFEYIQFLHIFMHEMPEAKHYQYVCGRTDIQAAHMCGYEQPEGRCVLFINDVYGVNSLGESLRLVLSGFGGKQLLVMIWHPSLLKVIDHFHLHRPAMVWPSLGPEICKYYVRSENDALFVNYEGNDGSWVLPEVREAMGRGLPLIVVNMMPEQECNYVPLDVRVRAPE